LEPCLFLDTDNSDIMLIDKTGFFGPTSHTLDKSFNNIVIKFPKKKDHRFAADKVDTFDMYQST
jgi:hypothetical protein